VLNNLYQIDVRGGDFDRQTESAGTEGRGNTAGKLGEPGKRFGSNHKRLLENGN